MNYHENIDRKKVIDIFPQILAMERVNGFLSLPPVDLSTAEAASQYINVSAYIISNST